jgi:hypothetical protein
MKVPDLHGAIVWGPGPLEPHHYLDLSWYAIHPIELLYTLMGTGCEEVSRMAAADSDEMVGRWKGGRIGSMRANRPHGAQGERSSVRTIVSCRVTRAWRRDMVRCSKRL